MDRPTRPRDPKRILLWAAGLVVAAASVTYTALWLRFNDPLAMVVGLVDDWSADTGEVALGPGDLLVVYSDGITEAADGRGEEFGEARLERTIAAHRDCEPSALLDVVFDEVRRFAEGEQADDQTMVIARVP